MKLLTAVVAASMALAGAASAQPAGPSTYDVLITNARVYDGSGSAPFDGEVAITGDRIAYVGPHAPARSARRTLDARGQAVAPGFINMLSHSEESLLVDGRGLSDLSQGVTLEVLGESSFGPLTPKMQTLMQQREGDIKYPVDWSTLDQYLRKLESRGISLNIASFVGAGTVRENVLGEADRQPDDAQLDQMKALVRAAMQDGAVGVSTALIYVPNSYARTPELIALAGEAARCGGVFSLHMRGESGTLLKAADEAIEIGRASGAPVEIYHLKAAGQSNWDKIDPLIAKIEAARRSGQQVSADIYPYVASSTGLDAAMPPWVQEGGLEKWVQRLKDPAIKARVAAEMKTPTGDWDNAYQAAGADGVLLLAFKTDRLKPYAGKTLAEVAKIRGETPEDTAIDLVAEDGSRIEVAYFEMSEDNIRKEIALPWVSIDSDSRAVAPEGVFLKSSDHPRAYGAFARVFARYVGPGKPLTVAQAVRKMTSLPAQTLHLKDRGRLATGYFADVVVFDPTAMKDNATFDHPQRLASGVSDVLVNGRFAFDSGRPTGAATGRVVRGPGWTGAPGGGCKASAKDWGRTN